VSLRLGLADHFGWAIAVTADADHRVVDRRRIPLIEPGMTEAPVHYEARRHDDARLADLIERARVSIARATTAAFDDLATSLPGPVASLSLRAWPPDFPTDVAVLRRTPWEARADAVMYRQVIAEVADARGWMVHVYDAKTVESQAAALLGSLVDEVLLGPRARLGPPWAKDHRVALAATVLAS
jgi:hypothetical protein